MEIVFNRPPITGNEEQYILQTLSSPKISGDGRFGKACQNWFQEQLPSPCALLTPSCTAALELAAILLDIKLGDEVIMPSYTFVSTANAFALRGATIVFVDIRPDTMNMDESLIEAAITKRTRAIVPVHYAGVACEMEKIMAISEKYNLFVIEDAAQGITSKYRGKVLGTIGHIGTYSFHETKNCTSGGEGGLLIVNDKRLVDRAQIIREKGTNRSQFFRGMVDKYQWVDIGGSHLMSEIQAAFLWGQLEKIDDISSYRHMLWKRYSSELSSLEKKGKIELPKIPRECQHNAHMMHIKVKNLRERSDLINHMKNMGIMAVFHYVPLHGAIAGFKYGRFSGEDRYTTSESERLLRLPMWHGLSEAQQSRVIESIAEFYS